MSAEMQIPIVSELCHIPPKTLVKSLTYGDTAKQIVVAEVVDRKVRWKDLVRVSTRGQSRFPSVLLKPLEHLSVESITCERSLEENSAKPSFTHIRSEMLRRCNRLLIRAA